MPIAALGTSDIIDYTLMWVDGAKMADLADAQYVSRRMRYDLYLQELAIKFWTLREWSWSLRRATLAAPNADGRTVLPADFQEIGRSGRVVDTATKRPFASLDIQVMVDCLTGPNATGKAYVYQISSQADTTGTRYIWFPQGWAGVATIDMFYKRIPPATGDGVGDEIDEIPIPWVWDVLIPGLRWMAYENSNDSKSQLWYDRYLEGINDAVRADRGGSQKDTTRVIGGSSVYRHNC
jgi:hypothetical protein